MLGDAVVFSHDLAALRGRIRRVESCRAAGAAFDALPGEAIDHRITFLKSVALRLGVYADASTSS